MKRCLEGQEPAEEIRNVVQEQIRRILALGAEEGLISGASPQAIPDHVAF